MLRELVETSDAALVLLDDDGEVRALSRLAQALVGPKAGRVEGLGRGDAEAMGGLEIRRDDGTRLRVRRLGHSEAAQLLEVAPADEPSPPTDREIAFLAQLAAHVPGVMWLRDLDGDRMLYISPSYERIWGRPVAGIYRDSMDFMRALHPEDRERVRAKFLEQLRRERYFDDEYRIVRPDGAVRWIRARNFPVKDAHGRVVRVAGFAYDITEAKRLEQALTEHAVELERRVEERTAQVEALSRRQAETERLAATARMAARIAHEINNPLAGVKNCLALLRRGPDRELLALADAEIDRIARIVHQMLDLHRSEEQTVARVQLTELLHAQRILLEGSARSRDVALVVEAPADASAELNVGLVRQILYNLVQNAIEATAPGGQVSVRATGSSEGLVFEVLDDGPGIDPDVVDRIFDPFFTTKSESGGLGLGLSICQRLATLVSGSVEVTSEPGRGTRFVLRLPHGAPEPTTAASRSRARSAPT